MGSESLYGFVFPDLVFLFEESDLTRALVDALRRGYIDFVELLMDYGVTLDKLTWADLDQLYASQDVSQKSIQFSIFRLIFLGVQSITYW